LSPIITVTEKQRIIPVKQTGHCMVFTENTITLFKVSHLHWVSHADIFLFQIVIHSSQYKVK